MKKIVILTLSSLILSGCTLTNLLQGLGQTSNNSTSTSTETAPEEKMVEHDSMMTDDDAAITDDQVRPVEQHQDILINMDSYKYTPNTITAKAGTTITIQVASIRGFHDFVIDELNVASEQLTSGSSAAVTIEIPADASGKSYEFYCSVGNHRQLGMTGTLIVQ